MAIFGTLLVTLLSFLTIHVRIASSLPNPGNGHGSQISLTNTTLDLSKGKNPLEQGPGPQVYGNKFTPPPFLPRHLAWDANLPIEKGNVLIVNTQTGEPKYNIFSASKDHRTFNITNMHGDQLLSVTLKAKARRGYNFRYHTPSGVSYRIQPLGGRTDLWEMTMEGNDPDVTYQTLTYRRGRKKNAGNMYFSNSTRVASFVFKPVDKSQWKSDTLSGISNTVQLDITEPTNIGDHYFIGQWAISKLRIDYYGK
ncbi:hypothetical protein MJO28_006823 [Puccinia striiformis f. sp. tritici]|uniref:Uncharacterized protein n=1 Tax=Puccinia striiformis f. sp. tritici TaxID=168172 RepID=A0ACC0EK34_9BASI|nr:hypothetical protein MJO28_006823 [Puccinia striiformis f. sp. tritici]